MLETEADIEVVGEASDGRMAVALTMELCPEVLLMDIAMPGLNGLEATRNICRRWPDTRPVIVAMTANTMEGDRQSCLDSGMDDFLAKPVLITDLQNTLTRWAKKE